MRLTKKQKIKEQQRLELEEQQRLEMVKRKAGEQQGAELEKKRQLEKIKLEKEQADRDKKKRLKRENDKKDKIDKFKKSLLEPKIKNNLIVWKDKGSDGHIYEGRYKDKPCFQITRGMILFTLKIINEKIESERRVMSSTELAKLQEKANVILHKNIQILNN